MNELMTKEFIVFDVETTGLSPFAGDRIVEIAALRVKDGKEIDRFQSLLNPQRPISMDAYMVNGISQEMVANAPLAKDVLPEFIDFCEGACLVGHNVKFDLDFLKHELFLIGRAFDERITVLDTLKMARKLLPQLKSHRLWLVARALDVNSDQQHRAMADVEMTAAVFVRLLDLVRKNNITDKKMFTCT